jgi:hypothetical protein
MQLAVQVLASSMAWAALLCSINQPCPPMSISSFARSHPPTRSKVACPSCGRKVAAGRFAPHLEKCMGRGRQASRNANKRISAMQD